MTHTTPIYAAVFASIASISAADGYQTGMQEIVFGHGPRPIEGILWYPSADEGRSVLAHGNAVWTSISVIPDAEPIAGDMPLVVLSHGMFGNARNQAWLASALTRQGYAVAAIDHPGTSTFNRDPEQRRMLWERPKDISRTIDYVTAESDIARQIDPSRIYMAGHSMGGFTAVALAGGQFDPQRWDAFCDQNTDELVCGIFDAWGVAKSAEDRVAIAQDLSDDRIAGFAVFDLGGTQTFSPESLAAIETPMLVIGAPETTSGLDLDIESRALMASLSDGVADYLEPETLAHFDFLGVCTEQGLAILKDEVPEDVFVCERGREERAGEHAMIVDQVAAFFK